MGVTSKFEFIFNGVSSNHGFYVVSDSKNPTSIVRIKSGEFSMSGNDSNDYIYAQGNAIVYVEGGSFGNEGTKGHINTATYDGYTGQVIITGGTFKFNPQKWVAEGYETFANNETNTTEWKVAPVGQNPYTTSE